MSEECFFMEVEMLHSERLQRDPRIAQAKKLIQEAVEEHRAALTDVRAPIAGRRVEYGQIVSAFGEIRGGSLFYPYLGSGLGNGALVELADGSVKFDMITGIGVHAFGHTHPGLLASGIDAAISDTVMQGNLQQNSDAFELSRDLLHLATKTGAQLKHCFLSTSGAIANENALKMLFQARHPANRLLAFKNCFAGRTLALSQVTDRDKYRMGLPTVLAVDYVPFYDGGLLEQSTQAAVGMLREHLDRYPGQHAGMMLELIQGEGGYYTAPREFFVSILEVLRAHQIPVFFDEIQTFGRTTLPFAFQHFHLDEFADVVTVGKMTQVCATLFRDELAPRPGLISQTFTGATSSIFAAREILRQLNEGNHFGEHGRLMQIHQRFVEHLSSLSTRSPSRISGPWGVGGMIAFSVFDGSVEMTRKTLERLFEEGVVAFSAGADPTRIRMLPPFGVITDQQIDRVCQLIERSLERVASEEAK